MNWLKNLLIKSRVILAIPVIGSMLLAFGAVFMGMGVVLTEGYQFISDGRLSHKEAKMLSITIIETLDFFLVGALAYITAVGFYKLFISQEDEVLFKRIVIENLTDLESMIVGVVIAALGVSFLGEVVKGEDLQSILPYGAGLSAVIIALVLFIWIAILKSKKK